MKNGVMKKTIISLLISVMIITPFSFGIAADETDLSQMGAYAFWYQYGYNTFSETTLTTTYESTTITNTSNYVEDWNVYDSSGNIVGTFCGFGIYNNTSSTASVFIKYVDSSGNYYNCSNCHLGTEGGGDVYNISSYTATTTIDDEYFHFLSLPSGDSFPTLSSYSSSVRYRFNPGLQGGDTLYIAWYSNKGVTFGNDTSPTVYSNEDNTYYVWRTASQIIGSYRFYVMTIECTSTDTFDGSDYITISFPEYEGRSDVEILPVYIGGEDYMTDDVRALCGLGSILVDGNEDSQAVEETIDTAADSLSSASDELYSIEDSINSDLTVQFNNIDVDGEGLSLVTNGNFLTTANWVRTQFNRMITGNVFGTLIYFSLVLGLALLVLGKLRK